MPTDETNQVQGGLGWNLLTGESLQNILDQARAQKPKAGDNITTEETEDGVIINYKATVHGDPSLNLLVQSNGILAFICDGFTPFEIFNPGPPITFVGWATDDQNYCDGSYSYSGIGDLRLFAKETIILTGCNGGEITTDNAFGHHVSYDAYNPRSLVHSQRCDPTSDSTGDITPGPAVLSQSVFDQIFQSDLLTDVNPVLAEIPLEPFALDNEPWFFMSPGSTSKKFVQDTYNDDPVDPINPDFPSGADRFLSQGCYRLQHLPVPYLKAWIRITVRSTINQFYEPNCAGGSGVGNLISQSTVIYEYLGGGIPQADGLIWGPPSNVFTANHGEYWNIRLLKFSLTPGVEPPNPDFDPCE